MDNEVVIKALEYYKAHGQADEQIINTAIAELEGEDLT